MAVGGCLLTASCCVKMLSPPVSPVTKVYFYLTDIWKVITTITRLHCSVYYAQAIHCLGYIVSLFVFKCLALCILFNIQILLVIIRN